MGATAQSNLELTQILRAVTHVSCLLSVSPGSAQTLLRAFNWVIGRSQQSYIVPLTGCQEMAPPPLSLSYYIKELSPLRQELRAVSEATMPCHELHTDDLTHCCWANMA